MRKFLLVFTLFISAPCWADGWVQVANDEPGDMSIYFYENSFIRSGDQAQAIVAASKLGEVTMSTVRINCLNGAGSVYDTAKFDSNGTLISKNSELKHIPPAVPGTMGASLMESLCQAPTEYVKYETSQDYENPSSNQAGKTIAKGLGKALLWMGNNYINSMKTQAQHQRDLQKIHCAKTGFCW